MSRRPHSMVGMASATALAMVLLAIPAAPARAQRFEVRDVRVEVGAERPGRFAATGQLRPARPKPDLGARFAVEASMKSTTASCSVDRIFANGFEQG